MIYSYVFVMLFVFKRVIILKKNKKPIQRLAKIISSYL
ncbi:hypothetical protein SM3_00869 [Enterococcus faecium EnGen0176]|nr:hypothetical protein OIO_03117 [Enterococcus faecium EnGen0031]EOG12597.1 hypothetical protein SM3_00869 [Enterococcus faecium EnGen0176]EOM39057.1 hypothetical protein SKU_02252 [Enterococcus faecium EnGen0173]OTO90863.1 hypothetical protein A5836_001711 [Enterococcus faecium]OTP05824.1 hypothetical protein A5860_000502 [Enterococcus faecium]